MAETMDRLSDLPKHILHDILSKMSVRDGVRTSILSKAWNHIWSTFPVLNFEQDGFMQSNSFINRVEKALKRFHDQGLDLKEFKLGMRYSDSNSMNPRVDYWMRLATESGVQEIELRLRHFRGFGNEECRLPPCIFGAKSLTKMSLWYLKVDNAFKNIPIHFSSLQELSLWFVSLGDEKIIQNIISSCPLIECLTLYCCHTMNPDQQGLKSVRIHGLHKLKKVRVQDIQEIDIDAPNLEDFIWESEFFDVPFKINVDECRNLRGIDLTSLQHIVITDQWLLELFGKFPLLERLKLDNCRFSKRIKFSCASLKFLEMMEMRTTSNLKEVIIDAPNLCTLRYHAHAEMPILTFLRSSSLLQFDVNIQFTNYWDFQKLREFLQGFEHRDILASLSLHIDLPPEFNPDVLRDISSSLPCIKHLNIHIISYFGTPVTHLVTGLLWSCCPATIFIPEKYGMCGSVVKVLEEMLINRKQDERCCSSSDIKCWWHGLKDVKVTRKVEDVVGSVAYPIRRESATFELKY